MYGRSGQPRNNPSRCEFIRVAALAGLGTLAAPALLSRHGGTAQAQVGEDPLHRRVRAELKVFTDWLRANGVRGYVGEVGWPDDAGEEAQRWNALADAWFQDADATNLWVTAWATGEWWIDPYYRLAVYENRKGAHDSGVESANVQASVIEAHPSTGSCLRGMNVCGGEFGAPAPLARRSRFSNRKLGTYNTHYHYDSQATFDYLAQRGIILVKLAFRWERLQRSLGGPLDATELVRLRGAVSRARAAGLQVLLDMHNYGEYYLFNGTRGRRRPIGGAYVTRVHFADVWDKISAAFGDDPGVVGYSLQAEPAGMPDRARGWELASQAAIHAIRRRGDAKLVAVSGYGWAGVQSWPRNHPAKWIDDPADNHRYEGHHYWDRNYSGEYARSYADEVADAVARGY
jgi:cellulase (glycosyl hydrolase family 5)